LSCETLSVFAKNETGFEESFNTNRVGAHNRCTFIAFRLYYDSGFYAHKAKQEFGASCSHSSTPKAEKKSESCDIM
jgi:hypothetical protein